MKRAKLQQLVADQANQVFSWDITWLRTDVRGRFLYAYVIIDVYSRKIVGWSVERDESPELAKKLFQRVIRDRKVAPKFVHADNGGPMKGITLVAFLVSLQIKLSYPRPRVSDANPFSEAFFKTLKYHVSYPKVFTSIEFARHWFANFVSYYNHQHLHSEIGYVTPRQKHTSADLEIFRARQETLDEVARQNPLRFSRGPRRVLPDRTVYLNRVSA